MESGRPSRIHQWVWRTAALAAVLGLASGCTDSPVAVDPTSVGHQWGDSIPSVIQGSALVPTSVKLTVSTGGSSDTMTLILGSKSTPTRTTGILSVAWDSLIPISCQVIDRAGDAVGSDPIVAQSITGRWVGNNCGQLRARQSGFDTLRVQVGELEADIQIVLAVRPMVSSPVGDFLRVDSLPSGTAPWAPTARRNSRGELEVYFAAYPIVSPTVNDIRADLHRIVSTDGVTFQYSGVALRHNDSVCALDGSGIESVTIVPRADGPGWRMFYSGGSFPCYGWQVFSAVSGDEQHWVKESGVRLTNGGTTPPTAPTYAPWPVGEGLVVEPMGRGWRMIVGGYEHILPYEDKFQIVEWHSSDQINWSYVGPVITTRQMPAAGRGTIYAPSILQIAPGLWRMIFNGDDRRQPGWRGKIWSAVSTDEHTWQLEGELLGGPTTKLWYASLVDNQLVFVRQDDGAQRRLAIATVTMP